MFVNPHRCLKKKTSELNRLLSNIIAIPHVCFGTDRIYEGKKRDLQGTFVTERMWNIKKQAHKRRTELINTGPP